MFYLIDKDSGPSSFQTIRRWGKQRKIKKIGHTGTLDPLATGLLLVATNEDTKLIDYVNHGWKKYQVTFQIGIESNTFDSTGDNFIKRSCSEIAQSDVEQVAKSFVGKQHQKPPLFSAKKINGKRAYSLARRGEAAALRPSLITIKSITNFKKIAKDRFSFTVLVSRGTYIRSLIHDIGQKLNCGAIMTALDRSALGNLTRSDLSAPINILRIFDLPTLTSAKYFPLLKGQVIKTIRKNGQYGLLLNNTIVAIAIVEDGLARAKKIFGLKLSKMENDESS